MTKQLFIALVFMFFSLTFGEMQAQKTKIGKDFALSIERTSCRGTCPAYKMSIDRKGNVQYEGIRSVKNIGKFHKKISKSQLKSIVSTIEAAKYFSFEDKYDDEGVADVPSCTFTYKNNGKAKTIYQRFQVPEALTKMTEQVEKLLSEDGYIKD